MEYANTEPNLELELPDAISSHVISNSIFSTIFLFFLDNNFPNKSIIFLKNIIIKRFIFISKNSLNNFMSSIKNIPSFKEFYYIEEGFVDELKIKKQQILNKWKDIKFYLTQDNYGRPINTRKVHSLKDEIFLLLKRLKDESIDSVKEIIFEMLKDYNISLRNEKLQTFFRISIWIIHIIAVLGLYKFKEMKAARRVLDGTATQEEYQILKNS